MCVCVCVCDYIYICSEFVGGCALESPAAVNADRLGSKLPHLVCLATLMIFETRKQSVSG